MDNNLYNSKTNYLFVRNSQQKSGLILLVPLTRIGANATRKWQEIVDTVNSSEVQSLVIIDKTPNKEASEYFKNLSSTLNAELLILFRPPSEQYFDSMKYIKLDEQLWILQLHDDDAWEGRLKIPDHIEPQRIFLSGFISVNKQGATTITDTESFPQRIIFSCLPARTWNKFVEFIESQGGHTAGSADSTLALVAYASSEFDLNGDFTYCYSTNNWDIRKSAQKHLTKLSQEDGWESFSSPRIAVMNRSIDNIAAVIFFRHHIQRNILLNLLNNQFHSFRLRNQKKVLFKIFTFILQYIILPILKILSSLTSGHLRRKVYSIYILMRDVQGQLKIILISDEIRNLQNLEDFIQNVLQNLYYPKLTKRFDFWVEQISIGIKIMQNDGEHEIIEKEI